MNTIQTAALTKTQLPRPFARWTLISSFALTFDFVNETKNANYLEVKNTFNPEETDPIAIRRFLYLTQRINNHQHTEPESGEMRVIWQAIERLRELLPV